MSSYNNTELLETICVHSDDLSRGCDNENDLSSYDDEKSKSTNNSTSRYKTYDKEK
ncbi:hypothetical protein K7G92_001790 [Pasteurella canis]|uniref:hypothetical protein n=1 Tax=Pasteurella canis TaxID=753 RepID=UPI001E60CF47|nr:hypothetical protein [Pasteurella canis]UEA16518.1 hypothetical protein K7G92_001790 [Pasteurella canis]